MENGKYYINDSTDSWEPYQVTESEALEAMLDFENAILRGTNDW